MSIFSLGYCQIEKGKFLIGGRTLFNLRNVNYNQTDVLYNTTEFSFSPQFGGFIFKGLAIGVDLPIYYADNKNFNTLSKSIAPFVKYYFSDLKLKPFIWGEAGVGNIKIEDNKQRPSVLNSLNSYDFYNIGVGLGYFFNEYISIESNLFYGYYKYSYENFKETNKDYSLSIVNFDFGLNIFL
jgi:hypothetical protein